MDTDELSREAYKAILIEAEKFNHDLTIQFGLLSYSCKNEREYLSAAKQLISRIRGYNKNQLFEIFFGSVPEKKDLKIALDKILDNISELEKIPENKRHYDF